MIELTEPELAMVRGFADGETYTQMSVRLGVTLNQAKAIAATMYRKLGVRHMSAAVAQAYRVGLLDDTKAAVERDWLLTEAPDEVRTRFFAARAAEDKAESGAEGAHDA